MVKSPPIIHVIKTKGGNTLRFEFQTTSPNSLAIQEKFGEKTDEVNNSGENTLLAVQARIENKDSFTCSYFNNVMVNNSSNAEDKNDSKSNSTTTTSTMPTKSYELFKITSKSIDLPFNQKEEVVLIELPNPAAPNTIQAEEVMLKKMKVLLSSENAKEKEEISSCSASLVDRQVFEGNWKSAREKIDRMLKFFEKDSEVDVEKFFTEQFPSAKKSGDVNLGEVVVKMLSGAYA